MTIEQNLFKNHIIDKNLLKEYGFKLNGEKFLYETNILNDEFKIVVEFDGQICGKIFDISTGDEYTNFRIESSSGFSSEVRENFIKILTDIRDKCTENKLFQTKQALAINKYISEKYQDAPEFLWKNLPTYAVFRKKQSNKWYAIIGTVPLNKVNKNSNSSEIVEIINVKVNKDKIKEVLQQKGIYEAFHMNKKNWVTIIFDKTLKDFEIEHFIDESYNNV
jgi:predicted DNA-binding protein (MmcQ/YjbR family)